MGEHRDRAVRLAFVGLLPHVARRLVADGESERRSLHLSRTVRHFSLAALLSATHLFDFSRLNLARRPLPSTARPRNVHDTSTERP